MDTTPPREEEQRPPISIENHSSFHHPFCISENVEKTLEAADFLSSFLDRFPVPTQCFDPTGKPLIVNTAHLELFGIKASPDNVSSDYSLLDDPLIRRRGFQPSIERVFKGESIVIPSVKIRAEEFLETHGITLPGDLELEIFAFPIQSADHRVVLVVVVESDISPLRRTERMLDHRKEMFTSLFNAITESAAVLSADGVIQAINSAGAHRMGFAVDELVGKPARDFFPGDIAKRREDALQECLRTKTLIRFQDSFQGRYFDNTFCPIPGENMSVDQIAVFSSEITEKKHADERLRASERRFRALIENTSDIVQIIDRDGVMRYVSPSITRILGYEQEEGIGANILDGVDEESAALLREGMQRSIESPEKVIRIVTRVKHKDGSWRIMEGMGRSLLDDPDIGGFVVTNRDITEQTRIEEALRHSEEQYRIVSETVPVVVYTARADDYATATFISGKIEELTGFPPTNPGEIPEMIVRSIHPEDLPRVEEAWEYHRKKQSGLDLEFRIVTRTGQTKWIRNRAVPVKDETGEVVKISGYLEDITESRKAQELLRESESKFRAVFEQSSEGLTVIDSTGDIIAFNKSQERMSGLKREDVLGKKIWDIQYEVMHPEKKNAQSYDEFRENYRELLQGGFQHLMNFHFESEIHRPDGQRILVETMLFPIQMESNRMFAAISRDVTELKRAQESLREHQRELSAQNELLQQKNIALREVMTQLESEKQRIARQVQANVDQIILPILSKIRMQCPKAQQGYLDLLEESLSEITSTYGCKLSDPTHGLTQKEIEVCNLVRKGMSSKEIGKLLNISHRTVETYRNRIRKKLNLTGTTANLASFLGNA